MQIFALIFNKIHFLKFWFLLIMHIERFIAKSMFTTDQASSDDPGQTKGQKMKP